MVRDSQSIEYHEQAVIYNDRVASEVEKIAEEMKHPTIKGWCKTIIHQHHTHAKLHREIIEHLKSKESVNVEAVSA